MPITLVSPFRCAIADSLILQPEHLPTSRIIPASGPLVPPDTLQHLLFEFSRFLSIVPAVIGLLYNVYQIFNTTEGGGPGRIDYFVSALWVRLTLSASSITNTPFRRS